MSDQPTALEIIKRDLSEEEYSRVMNSERFVKVLNELLEAQLERSALRSTELKDIEIDILVSEAVSKMLTLVARLNDIQGDNT